MEILDKRRMPVHVAIIMDGNGRWAKKNALNRISGHRAGVEAVRSTVTACRELGVKYLTLYSFSEENWLRPDREVNALMRLLSEFLKKELPTMQKNGVRLATIGNTDSLPERVRRNLLETMQQTAANKGMVLNLALSYSGRGEILRAVNHVISECRKGSLNAEDLSIEEFSGFLDTGGMPDPDLLIRTSGEYRISNFMLWQTAYTEFYFTDILWPDFRKKDLIEAISDYQKRERRFGLTSEQLPR